MQKNKIISIKMAFAMLMMVLLCATSVSCSHESKAPTVTDSDVSAVNMDSSSGEKPRETTMAAGDYIITNFSVKTELKDCNPVTLEEQAAILEHIRQYIGIGISENTATNLYISQSFPLLNLASTKRDIFVFQDKKCIGIVAVNRWNDKLVSSFTPLDSDLINNCLKERTPLVLISDGMRLWVVTETNSFPLNLIESARDNVKWITDYEPFQEVITLTALIP